MEVEVLFSQQLHFFSEQLQKVTALSDSLVFELWNRLNAEVFPPQPNVQSFKS